MQYNNNLNNILGTEKRGHCNYKFNSWTPYVSARQKYKQVTATENKCCASFCEVLWCSPCAAGQMAKTFENNPQFEI